MINRKNLHFGTAAGGSVLLMVSVHDLATELEVPSSKVLEVLGILGVAARSSASMLSEADASRVRNALKTKKVSGSLCREKRFPG